MDAITSQDTSEKVLYLTFDAGYENGNTPAILDALKKHQVKATFFVVGTYIDSEPELIRQIIKEGHTVGNHTWHHPDMSHISSIEDFQKELEYVETAYKNVTGKNMTKYYRPPQGKYSEANLQMAKELGYKSFFWSLAYVDWYQDNQPSKEEAFSKLLGRIHPGAIVLLHSTSSTNAEILDELLTDGKRWDTMYSPLKTSFPLHLTPSRNTRNYKFSTAAFSIARPLAYVSINFSYPSTSSATGSIPVPTASWNTLFSR